MATGRSDNGSQQEFQLETRHLVLLIALVIVLCLASFMLGRWVEREGRGPTIPSAASGDADANIQEMGDLSSELTFFDTLKSNKAAPLKPEPGGAGSRQPVAAQGVVPRPMETAAAPPAAPKTASSRRSVSEGVMIQVFASKDRASADAIRRRLRGKGYTALLVSDRGSYKVRVGPYADREEAQRAAATLREQEKLNTWIP